jgi:hypothetical protein
MTGYKRNIYWKQLPLNYKILQIYSNGLEYALVSPDYHQCHPFVWCKDFLHDVIHASLHDKSFEIYKFKFDAKVDPKPCLDRIRLVLTNSKDKKFSSKIPAVLDFINQIEDRLKIKKSFVRECANPLKEYEKAGVFMFEGSKRWIQAPPMLSLYTLMLRIGFAHKLGDSFMETIEKVKAGEIKPYQKKDKKWLINVEPATQKILRDGDRKIFHRDIQLNYPKNMSVDTIHNKLGIVGFASDIICKTLGQNVSVPYWHHK